MGFVDLNDPVRIGEGPPGELESDTMLNEIAGSLLWIPLEVHG